MTESLVAVGAPIDLSNCDREPIRIPGSIQPHGVLLTVAGPSGPVLQISANCPDLFGRPPQALLGATLDALFHAQSVQVLTAALQTQDATASGQGSALRVHALNPLAHPAMGLPLDCLIHRSGDVWIIELEPVLGDVALANTYHGIRTAVTDLNRATSNRELYDLVVRYVRRITGFDRVMLYRFDRDWNGEVHAEAKADRLESFRGLHYPAGDIPAQARALYTVNWLRFIRDVRAVNSPLVPPLQPTNGEPLDLSFAALRSVSPIHCEYLGNMGVTASMSVSIVIGGQLAGLIACHHYSGPYVPAPAVRATCEFLAQTLSLLVGAREQDEKMAEASTINSALTRVVRATSGSSGTALADILREQAQDLLAIAGAGGVAWTLDGNTHTTGAVPSPADVQLLRDWARARAGEPDGIHTEEEVGQAHPPFLPLRDVASGLLLLQISPDQDVIFFRPEVAHTIDWGGNPHLKELAVGPDGVPRLSPRGSFALWQETVVGRSLPFLPVEITGASALRDHLVLQMYHQARELMDVAETLQRSLLPEWLPDISGWGLGADYRPASAGVGGDWYDALELGDGTTLLVLGDVAGHGLKAAGTMGQLRNALRGYAVEDPTPARILARLDRLMTALLEDSMATVVIARLDPVDARVTVAIAGHPVPILRHADGTAEFLRIEPQPPLGAYLNIADGDAGQDSLTMNPGDSLLLYSDGVFERRDEGIDISLARWRQFAAKGLHPTAPAAELVRRLLDVARPPQSQDDATLLLLTRQ